LEVLNLAGADALIPRLPTNLVEFIVGGCAFETVSKPWLICKSLEYLDLNNNRIQTFPADLTGLPALKTLTMDLNAISSIPPIKLAAGDPQYQRSGEPNN
jgi:Leucine-rich repeat (LRR) protein